MCQETRSNKRSTTAAASTSSAENLYTNPSGQAETSGRGKERKRGRNSGRVGFRKRQRWASQSCGGAEERDSHSTKSPTWLWEKNGLHQDDILILNSLKDKSRNYNYFIPSTLCKILRERIHNCPIYQMSQRCKITTSMGCLGTRLLGSGLFKTCPFPHFPPFICPILPPKTGRNHISIIIIEFQYSWIRICQSIAFNNSCKKCAL